MRRGWGAALVVGGRGEGGKQLSLARKGVQGCSFLWRCLYELSVCGKAVINDNVCHKSCSARVSFYKINGAKTISSIANCSVPLGKHRALPCEHSSDSLHVLPAACSLEQWPRSEQPYPSACTAGQSLPRWPIIFAVSSRDCRSPRQVFAAQQGLASTRAPFYLPAAEGFLSPSSASPRVNEQPCTRT